MKSNTYYIWSIIVIALIIMPICQSTSDYDTKNNLVDKENTNQHIILDGKISMINAEKPLIPLYKIGLYIGMDQITIHFQEINTLKINNEVIDIVTPCQIEFIGCSGFGTPGYIILLNSMISPNKTSSFSLKGTCEDYRIINV